MSLILYPKNETAFSGNGLGILSDVIDDEVYEELNGQFELTMKYPVDGLHFSELATDTYITAKPNPVADPQPFRIYRITKPFNGVVTVYARHAAYKNKKIVVSPFTASSAPAALLALKSNAVNDCPFEFWTDKTTAGTMTVAVPTDIWTLLGGSQGSILDTYGGEYEFDKWSVKLWNRRGEDRGVSIRYGKNLTDLQQDENIANCFTGVYPYWADAEGNLVTLPEKYINGAGTFEEENIMPLNLSDSFETAPTEDQLRSAAEAYIVNNDIGTPTVSWTVEFVQLEQTEEYKGTALLERVLLGDTVSVIFPKLNVNAAARAVAIRYKPSLGRYKSVTLGKVRANLAATVAGQSKEISGKVSASTMQKAMTSATSWLTNGKGYKVERRDAAGNTVDTLYMDTPDITTAVNVLRIGQSGIGFSKTGVNGPYVSAWTIDGQFNADFIKGLELYGVTIKAGVIESADGKLLLDLTNNTLAIQTSNNIYTDYSGYLVLSAEGLWATNGGTSRKNSVFEIVFYAEGGIIRPGETGKYIIITALGKGAVSIGSDGDTVSINGTVEIGAESDKVTIGSYATNTETEIGIFGKRIDIGTGLNASNVYIGDSGDLVSIGGEWIFIDGKKVEWVYSSELGTYVLTAKS